MTNKRHGTEQGRGLRQPIIIFLVLLTCIAIVVLVYQTQKITIQGSLPPITGASSKEQYEIAKFAAEIQQIRSDTSGSLFWLKMIALFVTVGGAVGGYLLGQSENTRKRLAFEEKKNEEQFGFDKRKNIDAAYQRIVKELSDKSPLLRAAAAVKLGAILKSFPSEWTVSDARREELVELTNQVLSASLSIEENEKVLKTLTIALVMDIPATAKKAGEKVLANARGLDLSRAKAADAYWAKTDFTYADFYHADLSAASFRNSVLQGAQFRQANLSGAVLAGADCKDANFKLADLSGVDFSDADLRKANFEVATIHGTNFAGAKIRGTILTGIDAADNPGANVHISEAGDGSKTMKVSEWLNQSRKT